MSIWSTLGGAGLGVAGILTGNPALIGAGASIVGSGIGASADKDAVNSTNAANAAAMEKQIALQREFAQNGIQWRVEDAKKAGLSPLAALGASGASFSPAIATHTTDTSRGNMYRQMGQDLSRASLNVQTPEQRKLQALQLASLELQVKSQQIDNMAKLSQIARNNQVGPGLPSGQDSFIPGQNHAAVQVVPAKRVASEGGMRGKEAGSITDYGYVETPTGIAIAPSKDVKERIEDNIFQEATWAIRNQALPFFKGHPAPDPKKYPLPAGHNRWQWVPWAQEFRPFRDLH